MADLNLFDTGRFRCACSHCGRLDSPTCFDPRFCLIEMAAKRKKHNKMSDFPINSLTKIVKPGPAIGKTGQVLITRKAAKKTEYFVRWQAQSGEYEGDWFARTHLRKIGIVPSLASAQIDAALWQVEAIPCADKGRVLHQISYLIEELSICEDKLIGPNAAQIFVFLCVLADLDGFDMEEHIVEFFAKNRGIEWKKAQRGNHWPYVRNSDRLEIAERFADWIGCTMKRGDYDGKVFPVTDADRPYYSVMFTASDITGQVDVFGVNFIRVSYDGSNKRGTAIMESEADADKFMRAAFLNNDWDAAARVPRREPRTADVG